MTCEPHQSSTGRQQEPQNQRTVAINNESTPTEGNGSQKETPCWYASPEWALVVVGIITFVAIWHQAEQTKEAAEATRKSVEIQKAAMEQWIDTDDWSAGGHIPDRATEGELHIGFRVRNPTKFKLTLVKITLWLDREERGFTTYGKLLLAPDKGIVIDTFRYPVNGPRLDLYRQHRLKFEIGGRVSFIDSFNEPQEQFFGFHCHARPGAYGMFTPIAFNPPTEEEEENQKKRKRKPN